jgi:hypothetical protein
LRLAKYVLPGGCGCWLWTGAKNEHGYGVIGRGSRGTGNIKAHRAMYELFNGIELEPAIKVLHVCDNPACVNPLHLRRGSQADNLDDMRRKSRGSLPPAMRGERNPKSRLTEADVRHIFALKREGLSNRTIAKRMGVSKTTINYILQRKIWKHIYVTDHQCR